LPLSTRRLRRPASVLAVGAAGVLALLAGGCGTGGLPESGNTTRGKELFVEGAGGKQSCGSCHTLADAGTKGTIGPNLDEAFGPARKQGFKENTIASIVHDQIKYPSRGKSTAEDQQMPANLVTGDDADAVAAYVAQCAGNEDASGCTGPAAGGGVAAGGKAKGGKAIFTSAGCGSCHVLADAGTSGTTGPNLDQAKPSLEKAVIQVRNGGGGMPAFKDQLSEEQIRAVAKYVSSNAGR
jgi:mono/diheme cytochrome c family protein